MSQDLNQDFTQMTGENLPDSKITWWDNHYEDTYSDEWDDGYPYDTGTKIQE